jgi:hypothetical protein
MGFGGGKSGGTKGASGGGGLSGADFGLINSAFGMGADEISSRYHQLGLGIPDPNTFGGNPTTAAAQHGSLTYGSPSTMESMDIGGLGDIAQAALGQLQVGNINNPAISGTPANQIFNAQQAGQAGQAANTLSNLGGGTGGGGLNTTPDVSAT